MVKKLYKHEFLAWLRVMPILYGLMLAMAAINRCIQLFENDSVYYDIIFGSSVTIYVIALAAGIAAPMLFGVVRFYRNLFTGEGYLSFTLPVTPANHLWVKVVTAVSFSLLSVLVAALSGVIITAGEVFHEICKAIAYLLKEIPQALAGHLALYCLEMTVLMILSAFSAYFLYYMCICVGQMSRKNRILAAVGVYFGVYLLTQILGTGLSIVLVVLEAAGVLDHLLMLLEEYPKEAIHISLCAGILTSTVISAVCYLVCHRIIRKKLNLE
jgi:hypothetical protein